MDDRTRLQRTAETDHRPGVLVRPLTDLRRSQVLDVVSAYLPTAEFDIGAHVLDPRPFAGTVICRAVIHNSEQIWFVFSGSAGTPGEMRKPTDPIEYRSIYRPGLVRDGETELVSHDSWEEQLTHFKAWADRVRKELEARKRLQDLQPPSPQQTSSRV